jgi:geranylgeranyl diphosphate synthase type II
VTPLSDLTEYFSVCKADIEEALETLLPSAPGCPSTIAKAMHYSVTAGGKRFRPVLTLAAADAIDSTSAMGSSRALALPFACAIELIHTYSLVHDDLPAMDNDTLRRGRPTAHVIFGDGLAILSGDGLLTEAFTIMAKTGSREATEAMGRRLRAIGAVAEAAGAAGMVGGQAIDLEASGLNKQLASGPTTKLDGAALLDMHERKTGALIKAAAVSGAIIAGGSDAAVNAIRIYAQNLGLAFQIVDDILDVEGAAPDLGKTVGKDAAAGKPTYPSLYGVEASRNHAAEAANRARDALRETGLESRLTQIVDWVVSRTR